jgi:beta-glucuronidase
LNNLSRRRFVKEIAASGLAASLILPLSEESAQGKESSDCALDMGHSLNGEWKFKLDSKAIGESQGWYLAKTAVEGWKDVAVPHTWQVSAESAGYQGVAWYRRTFEAPDSWAGKAVRLEFEAVYHSAIVWLNDKPVGRHLLKGYTAFILDISSALLPGTVNTLVVKVDNSFNRNMLPRGNSYDWTLDGGIIHPVNLLVTPETFIERVEVDAEPELNTPRASLAIRVVIRNNSHNSKQVNIGYDVVEDHTGLSVLRHKRAAAVSLKPGTGEEVLLPDAVLPNPRLWHFDHPHLYRLVAEIEQDGEPLHSYSATFGARKLEVKEGGFYLNGERVWLMGVERMGGSHPDYGMAEPASWILHDHNDLKELNTVFTRVHWQQDKRVLDYCDRHGILIQEEVPTWGAMTFSDMRDNPSPEIMQNGLEQLREMIQRDRNHPSIFAWGLCNEINGQHPAAYQFAARMYEEAKRLDPHRLRSYASNSLQKTPEKDVAGLMDFIEWNEYYGTWLMGSVKDVKRNLAEIHSAFPDKVIVISEYGYCECTPERTGGDATRIDILVEHDNAFREYPYVGGAIFFCYNDYRTHIGDKGVGVMKQRVHGVVDLYGARKGSFEVLRRESSPLQDLQLKAEGNSLTATVVTRKTLPAYTLEGYALRWIVYAHGDLPMEQHEVPLPRLAPGQTAGVPLAFQEKNPARIRVDVMRPTGFSALTAFYKP